MKETAAALILVCLMALGVVCVLPVNAQPYQGSITINADGNVSPSTAPIQVTGNVYTLTSNVTGRIRVNGDNLVLDGNGHTLTYERDWRGSDAVSLSGVFNDTVKNLAIVGGTFGVTLWDSTSCVIANNTITRTGNGILALDEPTAGLYVGRGSSNIITGNIIANNYNAMSFVAATENNLIVGNTIENNKNPVVGVSNVMFWGASNNTIYHNNFIGNSSLAGNAADISPYPVNVWDAGFPLGGNYWSDYQKRYPNATEIDGSGIGNTSYRIDGQSIDRYPLMEPFNSTFGALQATPPRVSLGSPLNQTYYNFSVPLNFSVNVLSPVKSVNWTGYSLDGQQNVTITDNTTLTGLSSGVHNVTVYANDTYGNMAASETLTFTISPPFPIVPVAAVSVATIALVSGGLLVYFKKRKR